MSIHGAINGHIAAGTLHQIKPVVGSDPIDRTIIVANDIHSLLVGPWENETMERRANRLRADLETFVTGQIISVSMTPFEHKTAYMGLLDKPEHGVWDIRSRDPKPGLRVFGCFVETDVFIGFVWRPRSVRWRGRQPLGDRNDLTWELEKLECEDRWHKLFTGYTPQTGGDLRDFISHNAFLV